MHRMRHRSGPFVDFAIACATRCALCSSVRAVIDRLALTLNSVIQTGDCAAVGVWRELEHCVSAGYRHPRLCGGEEPAGKIFLLIDKLQA